MRPNPRPTGPRGVAVVVAADAGLAAAVAVDATTIKATRARLASHAGKLHGFARSPPGFARAVSTLKKWGSQMPRGRSTFTKRQKEQARQQKARDKAEKKSQIKQDRPEGGLDELDEAREMREAAEAQAALFAIGAKKQEFSTPQGSKES